MVQRIELIEKNCMIMLLYIVMIFLAICHSFFEDNFVFIAIGADPVVVLLGRFLLALAVTVIISRLWKREPELFEPAHTIVDLSFRQNNSRGE